MIFISLKQLGFLYELCLLLACRVLVCRVPLQDYKLNTIVSILSLKYFFIFSVEKSTGANLYQICSNVCESLNQVCVSGST